MQVRWYEPSGEEVIFAEQPDGVQLVHGGTDCGVIESAELRSTGIHIPKLGYQVLFDKARRGEIAGALGRLFDASNVAHTIPSVLPSSFRHPQPAETPARNGAGTVVIMTPSHELAKDTPSKPHLESEGGWLWECAQARLRIAQGQGALGGYAFCTHRTPLLRLPSPQRQRHSSPGPQAEAAVAEKADLSVAWKEPGAAGRAAAFAPDPAWSKGVVVRVEGEPAVRVMRAEMRDAGLWLAQMDLRVAVAPEELGPITDRLKVLFEDRQSEFTDARTAKAKKNPGPPPAEPPPPPAPQPPPPARSPPAGPQADSRGRSKDSRRLSTTALSAVFPSPPQPPHSPPLYTHTAPQSLAVVRSGRVVTLRDAADASSSRTMSTTRVVTPGSQAGSGGGGGGRRAKSSLRGRSRDGSLTSSFKATAAPQPTHGGAEPPWWYAAARGFIDRKSRGPAFSPPREAAGVPPARPYYGHAYETDLLRFGGAPLPRTHPPLRDYVP
ncbi:hypothetical protein DIPPA_31503 [Diplonema papillatum]|nr:hypothetical protein DIPPA_31503 [Diplonema papillatum]